MIITNTLIECPCGCDDMLILDDPTIDDDQIHVRCMDCEEEYILRLAKGQK